MRNFPSFFTVFFWINLLACPFVLYIYRRATVFFYLLLENFLKEFDSYRELTMAAECAFLFLYVGYMVLLSLAYFRRRGYFFPVSVQFFFFLVVNLFVFTLAYLQLYR